MTQIAHNGFMKAKGATADKQVIVTTSWDDGHPLDIRLADLLASYGIRGTFYVPINYYKMPPLREAKLWPVKNLGMEIGAHGMAHTNLTKTRHLLHEVIASKIRLEDLTGAEISSFCYPKGEFNHKVCSAVADAGYRLGRTTIAFRTSTEFDAYRMPVSIQFSRHSRSALVRHALKDSNFRGLADWWQYGRLENDPLRLAELTFEHVLRSGGIFHLWGHSWEIESQGLWKPLESLFKRIVSRSGIQFLTNAQTLNAIGK